MDWRRCAPGGVIGRCACGRWWRSPWCATSPPPTRSCGPRARRPARCRRTRRSTCSRSSARAHARAGGGQRGRDPDRRRSRAARAAARAERQAAQHGKGQGTGFVIHAPASSSPTTTSIESADDIRVRLADERELTARLVGKRRAHRHRAAQDRRRRAISPVAPLGNSDEVADRRVGGRDRQPVRPRPHGHRRHRQRQGAPRRAPRRRAAPASTTSSRPTRRSTPATRAGRSSTRAAR